MRQPRNLRLVFATVAAVCFAVGCLQNFQKPGEQSPAMADTRAADETAIRAGDADFVKAAETNDLDKAMSLYADDAVFLGSGVPAQVGKENIRKVIQGLLAAPGLHFTVNITSVTVARSGDLAMDQGTVEETATDKKGKTVTNTSQYVLVWKKMPDGSWKIAADTSANRK
jgi:uncharacterized protein (TIGR02246 family)